MADISAGTPAASSSDGPTNVDPSEGARQRSWSSADLAAGIIFVLLGLAFALGSLQYEMGTLLKMGPGYVPLSVGLVLCALGVGVIVKAFVGPDRTADLAGVSDPQGAPREFGRLQWRPTVLVLAAVLFFALTFEGLGLFLSVFGTSLLASYARPGTTAVQALAPAAGLTVASWLIFVLGLQQRLPLVGEWLGG